MKVIIPQPQPITKQPPTWQMALREMITCPKTLLDMLELSENQIDWQWDKTFPLRVTRSFVQRMQKGNPHDPLLKQVLSLHIESHETFNCSSDPLHEKRYNPIPGLLHKYPSRVLLTFTSSCAIHCRYCFRRHFAYTENNPGQKGWQPILDYIQSRPEIIEVILSGGDPLMAQDEQLARFIEQLESIPHVQLLRFHTRLPVVLPERITATFVKILENTRLRTTLVYHINHPAEIVPSIAAGVDILRQKAITVLNQAVLLRGINDHAACLKQLSLTLFQAGILPYYIHLLDSIKGAAHFNVSYKASKKLQAALRATLPGYLVPKFVKEIPEERSKMPLDLITG